MFCYRYLQWDAEKSQSILDRAIMTLTLNRSSFGCRTIN